MPGPYAHITLLHELMRPGRWLDSSLAPSARFREVLSAHFPFCALGAVSPDYPNLATGEGAASQWADVMHCTRACEMVTSGVKRVRRTEGAARDKQLAWLLGYCAHLAADVTIHPVVQTKVGVYAENQRQHRICEMNQDSYIYRRMDLGEIGESDLFAMTIAQCSDCEDGTRLDPAIVSLWGGMLADVHPGLFVSYPPDIASWHREFASTISGYKSGAPDLFPLAAVIASKLELAYPSYDEVDRQFVVEQAISSDRQFSLHYDDIFDHAAGTVLTLWRQVELALCSAGRSDMPMLGDWNLDTGRDEYGRLVFWE